MSNTQEKKNPSAEILFELLLRLRQPDPARTDGGFAKKGGGFSDRLLNGPSRAVTFRREGHSAHVRSLGDGTRLLLQSRRGMKPNSQI